MILLVAKKLSRAVWMAPVRRKKEKRARRRKRSGDVLVVHVTGAVKNRVFISCRRVTCFYVVEEAGGAVEGRIWNE